MKTSQLLHRAAIVCFVVLAIVALSALHRIGFVRVFLLLVFGAAAYFCMWAARHLDNTSP